MSTDASQNITQSDVDTILSHLKELREQVASARNNLAQLETNLSLAYEEYKAVVGSLQRRVLFIQSELELFHIRLEGVTYEPADAQVLDTIETETTNFPEQPIQRDAEAIFKDVLLEHLFRVLDPMVSNEDADLLARLQGFCNLPSTGLAEALEQVPWGIVWNARALQENLTTQYLRLASWEQALMKHLSRLQLAAEQITKDSRYGLWQQRQRGPEGWQNFLQETARQQQRYVDELMVELNNLRAEWSEIQDNV